MQDQLHKEYELYSSVSTKVVDWLWYPYIPYGKLTILQGDPGCGKSTFIIDVISSVTTGKPLPNGIVIEPHNVIYQCSEDGLADTIKPRLVAAGADCNKVAYINEDIFGFSIDDEIVRDTIIKLRARLMVIDPFQAYLGDADLSNAMSMRIVLRRLSMWASQYDCAIVLVGHLNKKSSSKELYRGLGSIDVAAAARSVLQLDVDEENEDYKKFDLILCASVSRFARNVSECLEYVSKLKTMNPAHPISVYFESEGIDTLDPTTSQNLDIHALMADWESRIKSGRMILSYDQRIFTCQFPVSDLLGYRHTKAGKLVMVPEEAKTVRVIFLAYLCGYSAQEIAEILTEKQRPTLKGRTDWNAAMVKNIMTNERRWGSLQARKSIVIDYKQKKVAKNNGDREAAFVKHHHAGIVSPEIAKAVQYLFPNRSRISGHQEVYVIPEGGLKGFVNINPSWYAITNDAFLDLCCSVYSDEEIEELERDSKILSGEEHSRIIQMDFAGYQVPYGVYFLTRNMPSMTISNKTLKFNKACHTRFDDCEFIEVLYHPILQMVAIRACDEETPTSIRWKSEAGKVIDSIHSKAFSDAIFEKMNWIKDYSFQFRGFFRESGDAKILFFSLDEPRIHVGKKKPMEDSASDEPFKFIEYKNATDSLNETVGCNSYAYPTEWQTCFGLNSKMRERRENLAENITEADIRTDGTCAVNPLIGELPTKQEVLEELEDLLISM